MNLKLRKPPELTHARALLWITLFALPLMLIFLGTGDANAMMELFNLVPVREAYRDGHWLMPTLNGLPRLQKPPLPVWLPAGLAYLAGSDSLWILRLPSVLLGLLTCWATYGLGVLSFKDRRQALMAALILASTWMFIRQGRLASYDIYSTAFVTVGLFGLVGLMERPGYWWAWSLLAGTALGLSVMSKGPVPAATICLPLGLWILAYQRRSWRAWAGLLLGALVSVAVFWPWLGVIGTRYPEAWSVWKAEFLQYSAAQGAEYYATKWYYFGFLLWFLPWTPVLIAGLVAPFIPAPPAPETSPGTSPQQASADRRNLWLYWMITLLGLAILTLAHEKKQRYALQQMPTAALLCAWVWMNLCRHRGPLPSPARVLLAAQTVILVGAGSLSLLALTIASPFSGLWPKLWMGGKMATKIARLPLELAPCLEVMGPWFWLGFSLLLIYLGFQLDRAQKRGELAKAFKVYALASWILLMVGYWVYRAAPGFQANPLRPQAQALVEAAGGHPIETFHDFQPWLDLVYYANQILTPREDVEILTLARIHPLYVLASPAQPWRGRLEKIAREAGCPEPQALYQIFDGHHDLVLYRLGRIY